MGRDAPPTSGRETIYECLDCGYTTPSPTHPGDCPRCDVALRNRATPIE